MVKFQWKYVSIYTSMTFLSYGEQVWRFRCFDFQQLQIHVHVDILQNFIEGQGKL